MFRTGLGILRLYEDVLLQMDFIHMAQFLSRLPDELQPHTLFSAMANTHMIGKNGRWAQVGAEPLPSHPHGSDRSRDSRVSVFPGLFCFDEGRSQRDG